MTAKETVALSGLPSPKAAPFRGAGKPTAAERVKDVAAKLATVMAEGCPMSEPGDQDAFDTCRTALFNDVMLRQSLASYTLFGAMHSDHDRTLRDTRLTRLWPDALLGLYLPLFMFSGTHAVSYSETEKLYRVELGVRFRNRLEAGQFPEPFWHEAAKWSGYEGANALLLWLDPTKLTVRYVQFGSGSALGPASENQPVMPATFDGKWMWTDQRGRLQPRVTLFDGLVRADNPYLTQIDAAYQTFAISLRDGQCLSCHVPSNPNKMKRLVLLHTPAHAASEIKRVLGTVRRGSMPLSEISNAPEDLDPSVKEILLARAVAFETAVEGAKAWETAQRNRSSSPVAEISGPAVSKASAAIQKN